MALPTNSMTITTANSFMPILWSKKVISAVESNLVCANKVWRFDDEVAEKGQAIRIPNLSNLTAHAKSAATVVNLDSNDPTETNVTILVNYHYECSFLLEDVVRVQSSQSLQEKYTAKAAYAIGKQIDTSIATLAAAFTQQVGNFTAATISDSDIVRAIQYLDDADAPQTKRNFIVKPEIKAALLKLDKFSLAYSVGKMQTNAPVRTGEIGDIYGIPMSISTNVYKTSSNTTNMLIQEEVIGCAIQKNIRVQAQNKIEYLGTLVVVDAIWGCIESRGTFGVGIRS